MLENSQVQTTADALLHDKFIDNMSMTTLFFLDSAGPLDLPIRSDLSHAVAALRKTQKPPGISNGLQGRPLHALSRRGYRKHV